MAAVGASSIQQQLLSQRRAPTAGAADAVQDNIAVLKDAEAGSADKAEALGNLQVLVEPIDNANGEQQQQTVQQHRGRLPCSRLVAAGQAA